MKKLLIAFTVSFSAISVMAQQTPPPPAIEDSTLNDYEDDSDTSFSDKEFKTVQIESKFPGGPQAWRSYLEHTLRTNVPVKNKAPKGVYTVIVSFLVNKEGKVSEPKLITDPGYGCGEEVLRIIKKSPDWSPAVHDGKNVIYRQKQSITFVVE